jgi:hypothetical protein
VESADVAAPGPADRTPVRTDIGIHAAAWQLRLALPDRREPGADPGAAARAGSLTPADVLTVLTITRRSG